MVPEAPAGGGAPVPAARAPGPAPDTSLDIQAGSTAGDDAVPPPQAGRPRLFADVVDTLEEVTDCVVDGVLTLSDGSLLDCVTGLPLLDELPVAPADPRDPVLEPVTP